MRLTIISTDGGNDNDVPSYFYFTPFISYAWDKGNEHMYIGWFNWVAVLSFGTME